MARTSQHSPRHLLHNKSPKKNSTKGFTIIEVMIVLAIAGLIMLIIFLVIPHANQVKRDYARKRFVNYVASELAAYKNSNNFKFPSTNTEKCNFMTSNLKDYVGTSASCVYDASKDCMLVQGTLYDVCFHGANTSSHGYLGQSDEISIQTGHWCNVNPVADNENPSHPITSGPPPGRDGDLQLYVVWDVLETTPLYCVSNF
jgi:prepilin-type N-terminal cleavage/methylation domain-containing protein